MPKKWDKRVLCILMQWDYCDKRRGISGDKLAFLEPISELVKDVDVFWYDEYIHDLPKLRQLVYEKAEAFGPDLIFFPTYTDQFDAGTLDRLKARWQTCGWFGDDTWRFDSYSSRLAPHFTHVCTTDVFSVEKYRGLGIEPILTQWAAASVAGAAPMPPVPGFRYDVSFVGAYNQVRGWFVKMLGRHGIMVDCFGAGWPNGKITTDEMFEIFRHSKINLNLSNSVPRDIRYVLGGVMNLARYLRSPKKAEQIKARNFEIPLAGGFQLTNYVPSLDRYLKIGEEVAVYSSPEDCAELIRHYLKNEPERSRILLAGHARAVREHTFVNRFRDIFSSIWER